jgi:ubiquinone/menaquinone biosynthesis C-methylase UbiE
MMDRPMNNFGFRFMSTYFRFRDYFSPPTKILERVGIQAGSNVLDFGAGSGSYSIPAAQLVGPTGKVYAADIHPLAINEIRKRADMKRIKNLHTIRTACETELPNASIDVILLFYVLHDFKNPDSIIRELVRILKPKGILVVIDHKFDKDKVVSTISHATSILKPRDTELRNGKSKETVLVFLKQESLTN